MFQRCMIRCGVNHYAMDFYCLEEYLALAFAQLTYREAGTSMRISRRF